jgi:hypothetical protein
MIKSNLIYSLWRIVQIRPLRDASDIIFPIVYLIAETTMSIHSHLVTFQEEQKFFDVGFGWLLVHRGGIAMVMV